MSERIVKPNLEIINEPPKCIGYLHLCQYNQSDLNLVKEFYELSLSCKLLNLEDFNLPNLNLYVSVSLVFADDVLLEKYHPYFLKCLNSEVRIKSKLLQLLNNSNSHHPYNCYLFKLDKTSMTCNIQDLYIINRTLEQMEEYYEDQNLKEYLNSINSSDLLNQHETSNSLRNQSHETNENFEKKILNIKSKIKNSNRTSLDLNYCRLKLQVVIHDLAKNKLSEYITEPVFTREIQNSLNKNNSDQNDAVKKNMDKTMIIKRSLQENSCTNTSLKNLKNLRILRYSRLCGSMNGGDEIFILTSYFNPFDIEVEFIQFKSDTEIAWRAMAIIDRADIHGNCSLIIKTPKYLSTLIEPNKSSKDYKMQQKVKVYFRLFRPSTKDFSEKSAFYYCQNDFEYKNLFNDILLKESRLIKKNYFSNKQEKERQEEDIKKLFLSSKRKKLSKANIIEGGSINSLPFSTEPKRKKRQTKMEILGSIETDFIHKQSKTLNENIMKNDEENENSEEEYIKKLDKIINFYSPKIENGNDDNEENGFKPLISLNAGSESSASSTSPSSMSQLFNKIKIDPQKANIETQTDWTLFPKKEGTTLEEKFEIKSEELVKATALEYQLKVNLDNCIAKMNALADRTGKALVKFAKTRSFHELLKTQRFLINIQDDDGNTPIHLCILYGNFDLLEVFVDVALTIPYQNLINIKNFNLQTPLMIATLLEEVEVCEFLLEANADLTPTDINGNNVVHLACKTNNLNLLKTIVKYLDKTCCYGVLNSLNYDGYAPIHLAVLKQSTDLIRELLYLKNLKINIQDKCTGYTALHHAASNFNLIEICKLLVKNEMIDVNIRSYNGSTPLLIAVANKNYLITCLLLNNKADLNAQNDLPMHCDHEQFQIAAKKNNLLRRAVELAFSRIKGNSKNENQDHKLNKDKTIIENRMDVSSSKSSTKISILEEDISTIKLSQEIKKIYEEFENQSTDNFNDEDDPKFKIMPSEHNWDAIALAQNDLWMLEIFKNTKFIKKELLEKIICYEKYRQLNKELQPFISNLNSNDIKRLRNNAKDFLNNLEKTSIGQIKLSQQATPDAENEKMNY